MLKLFLKALNATVNKLSAAKLDTEIKKKRILNSIQRGYEQAVDASKGIGPSRNAWEVIEEL